MICHCSLCIIILFLLIYIDTYVYAALDTGWIYSTYIQNVNACRCVMMPPWNQQAFSIILSKSHFLSICLVKMSDISLVAERIYTINRKVVQGNF